MKESEQSRSGLTTLARGEPAPVSDDARKPPFLAGYTYDPEQARLARDAGRLLAIRLESNRTCNLRCGYCYAESGSPLANELAYEDLANVVMQAAALGAMSVVLIGGGEPTLYPRFVELVTLVDDLGMIPVVFTNMTRITPGLAAFLHEKNASVMGKMDSIVPETQDLLIGRPGASEMMAAGLANLVRVGFTRSPGNLGLRLGLSCVTCRANLRELSDIWRYCRESNIFPNMEVLTPTGRAPEVLSGQFIDAGEIKEYKLKLLDIDRAEYGYDWLPYTPLPGSGCMQYMYSMYVTVTGDVRPCAPTKLDENAALRGPEGYRHNVRRASLADIYESPLFEYVRNIDHHLDGGCAGCPHIDQCIGCRGYAYTTATTEGKDVFEALRSGCRHCFKNRE